MDNACGSTLRNLVLLSERRGLLVEGTGKSQGEGLMQRYFDEPYRFISPYRGTFWCRLAQPVAPRHLRKSLRVARWHFQGLEHLHDSLGKGAGVLLASNHCRWADPLVLGMLSLAAKRYFFYVASHHLFRQRRLLGWLMNRLGGFSILREGSDRESLRTCAQILARAERPLVLFPEGTWCRQNDRLGRLQEGVSLITRQASRQSDRPILVHPVAIKYWLMEDPRPVLSRRLAVLERGMGWREQSHLDLPARIEKVEGAWLALMEIEFMGHPQSGCLDERIARLADHQVSTLEQRHLPGEQTGHILERIRRLRHKLVRGVANPRDPAQLMCAKQELDVLLFCENLSGHSMEYLAEGMTLPYGSLERITETVQRLEESMTDQQEVPMARMGACVTVGPALDARALNASRRPGGVGDAGVPSLTRESADPLIAQLSSGIQGLLDQHLRLGPPPDWNCPQPASELLSYQLVGSP
jgi:hypothetical protein